MTAQIDVLVPTCDRPVELATTLAGLAAQTDVPFRVLVSDQSEGPASYSTPAAETLIRALRMRGTAVELHRHLPRRGIAEQRSFLLSLATAPAVLFLDDDVWLEAGVLHRLHQALRTLGCGFVAAAMQGLSHLDDRRPDECAPFEVWEGPVRAGADRQGRARVGAVDVGQRGQRGAPRRVARARRRCGAAVGPLGGLQDRLGRRLRPVRPRVPCSKRAGSTSGTRSRTPRTARTCWSSSG